MVKRLKYAKTTRSLRALRVHQLKSAIIPKANASLALAKMAIICARPTINSKNAKGTPGNSKNNAKPPKRAMPRKRNANSNPFAPKTTCDAMAMKHKNAMPKGSGKMIRLVTPIKFAKSKAKLKPNAPINGNFRAGAYSKPSINLGAATGASAFPNRSTLRRSKPNSFAAAQHSPSRHGKPSPMASTTRIATIAVLTKSI